MLFYSGITRSADAILKEQTANVAEKLPSSASCATSPRARPMPCAAVTPSRSASR